MGKVTQRSPFVGYAGNKQQTEKKRLRDVLKKGDLYFNTGDLLRLDRNNFVYFQDRVGDTFRQVESVFIRFSSDLKTPFMKLNLIKAGGVVQFAALEQTGVC